MNQLNALRYLLLMHLWKLRHHVTAECHREIARSLVIAQAGDQWLITWHDRGVSHTFTLARAAFQPYRPGDKMNASGATATIDRSNHEIARAFARTAYSLPESACEFTARPVFFRDGIVQFCLLAVTFLLMVTVDASMLIPAAALAALAFSEFSLRCNRPGRLVAGLAMAALGGPWTGATINLGLGLLAFFDPIPRLRLTRTSLHLIAAVVGPLFATSGSVVDATVILGGLVIAISIAIARWIHGTHFRHLPLLLPVVALALVVDGHAAAGMVLQSYAVLELCLAFRPVKKYLVDDARAAKQ